MYTSTRAAFNERWRSAGTLTGNAVIYRFIILPRIIIKIKIHSSCEIEDFVETHLCKLCVILRSRVLRVVCPH